MKTRLQHGVALIELIIFIVVVGIITVGALRGIFQVLQSSNDPNQVVKAAYLANARMQVIMLYRAVNGVSGLSDPCSTNTLAACSVINSYATSNGFTINATTFTVAGSSTTVRVSLTGTGLGASTMETVVSNYDN